MEISGNGLKFLFGRINRFQILYIRCEMILVSIAGKQFAYIRDILKFNSPFLAEN